MVHYLKLASFIKKNSVVIFFLLIVLSDALTKILISDYYGISKFVKAFLIVCLIIFSLIKERVLAKYFLGAFLLFAVGSLSISFSRFMDNVPQFFEYYFLIFYFILYKHKGAPLLNKVLDIVFIFHAFIIIAAAIFDFSFLKTYAYSERFGYTSFFNSQNEFSYVMIAGIVYFTAMLNKHSTINIMKLLLFLIASLVVGTKAILVFVVLFYISLLVLYTKPKVYISLFIGLFVTLSLFWNHLLGFFKSHYSVLHRVYIEEGWISFLSSKRSTYFFDRFSKNYEEMDFINYLLGSNNLKYIYEMSFFDLLSFLGLLGFVVYVIILKKFLLNSFTMSRFLILYLILISGLSFVAGYLFENASAQVYTVLVIIVLNHHLDDSIFSHKNKENINA